MMEYTVLTSSLAGGLGIRRAVFDMFYENVKPSGVNFLWADVSADNPDAAVFPRASWRIANCSIAGGRL